MLANDFHYIGIVTGQQAFRWREQYPHFTCSTLPQESGPVSYRRLAHRRQVGSKRRAGAWADLAGNACYSHATSLQYTNTARTSSWRRNNKETVIPPTPGQFRRNPLFGIPHEWYRIPSSGKRGKRGFVVREKLQNHSLGSSFNIEIIVSWHLENWQFKSYGV